MGTIRKIDEPKSLGDLWGRVFISDDPFGWPFTKRIESGIVFYPTAGYHLPETQYNAMLAAARASGDDGFIVSVVEGEGDVIARGEHWWCEYPSYEDYMDLPLVLENAIYSKSGLWGIMVSHEDHAVVGGSDPFVEKLSAGYPGWQTDAQKLINAWKGNPNGSWVGAVTSQLQQSSS